MAPTVSKIAPDFSGEALFPDGQIRHLSLQAYLGKGKNVVLFFYPFDFSFVCPSEIIAFNNAVEEFIQKDVVLIGCSVDSVFTHRAWTNTPLNKGGIGKINFPLMADVSHEVAEKYGVLHERGMAMRGTFFISKDGILQSSSVNNLPLGRSVEEMKRLVDAFQHHETYGEVCPANWKKGAKAMEATEMGVANYLAELEVV